MQPSDFGERTADIDGSRSAANHCEQAMAGRQVGAASLSISMIEKRLRKIFGKANTSFAKSSKRCQAYSGQQGPTASRPISISACWTIAACDLRILSNVVGRRSSTRTTFQKPQRLSIARSRPELRIRV